MSFEFGRPLPAAEMRLKCCGTLVLDCKGVYCSAHNAAMPSGIRSRRRISSGGLASVVLLVGGAGPVIVLVILAAGAGVALAAGAGALAVLDVAVAAFGGGARAAASTGFVLGIVTG
jgi:hypothetical protein